jgi:hypothetical protein
MAKREAGLHSQRSIAKPILGLTDFKTVMLDFDNSKFKSVKYWSKKAMEKYDLGGFIILISSKNSYHVVFNRYVSQGENRSVIAWVAIVSKNVSMLRYLAMQCIKGVSTVRISEKNDKPPPRIVYRFGSQGNAIKDFLSYRQLIKWINHSL